MLKSPKKHEEKTEEGKNWKDKSNQSQKQKSSKEKYMWSEEGKTKRYKT